MAEYKVIFRADTDHPYDQHVITWEQGCPLMFEAIQISRETESGKAFLQTKVRNLSGAIASSFKARLTCHYKDGSTEEFETEPLDADIAPCGEYALKPIALSRGDAAHAEALVLSVDTSDGNWTSTATACPLPRRSPLALSADALNERISQLRERGCNKPCEAAPYSYVEHDGWSQCPCGQISIGCRVCPSCGLRFGNDTTIENGDFLEEAALERAQKTKDAEEAKAERNSKLKRSFKRWGLIGGAVAVLLVCAVSIYALATKPLAVSVVSRITYGDSEKPDRTDSFLLDTNGNILELICSNTGKESMNYEIEYTLDDLAVGFPVSVDTSNEYDESCIQKILSKDESGRPTEFSQEFDGVFNPGTVKIEYYEDGKVKTVVEETVNTHNDTYVYLFAYNDEGNLTEMTYACTSGATGESAGGFSYYYTYEKDASGEVSTCIKTTVGLRTDEVVEYTYEYADGNISKVYKDGKQLLGFEYVSVENPSVWTQIRSSVNPSQIGGLLKTAPMSTVY